MIEPPVDAFTEPVARARRFAALSGPFDPHQLRDVVGSVTSEVALAVASVLADVCDTDLPDGLWLMRGTARRREIEALVAAGFLTEAIEWRRSMTTGNATIDGATVDILDALTGSANSTPPSSEEAADRFDADALKRIAVALDRAGERAPAHGSIDLVRSALGRKDTRERSEAMLKDGFFGRTAELARIARWLAHPSSKRPVKALFISGLPGIGKSTLIDESVRRAMTAVPPWIVVRLDFDRSGLDVQDRVGLTIEISRQVSIALGDAAPGLRQARLTAAGALGSTDPDLKGERREHVPDQLARALADAIAAGGRPVLIILDTLEVLRGRGETHPQRLFDCLDELCDRGLRPIAVIGAGRGEALESVKGRVPTSIILEGLDQPSAEAMLSRLNAPPASRGEILSIAEGNPLVLRLAAQVVREAGSEALDSARRRRGLRAAFLYRVLLSRIGDPTLQSLAEPGLIVRRINPDLIGEVLAPQLLRHRLDPQAAVQVFDTLSTNHWLVEPDPTAPGWVRHRSDIRRVLLRLLYEGERAGAAARIDRAAAKWFGHRPEAFAPIESAYHHLQATRRGDDMPSIDPQVLQQFDAETIAELPEAAQDYVRSMRGERTSQFRAGAEPLAAGPLHLEAAAKELEATIERGDIIEAGYVYDRALAGKNLDPSSSISDIARTYLWRAGRWRAATRDIGRQRPIGGPDDGLREESPVVALARLEMAAELCFAGFVQKLVSAPDLLLLAGELRMRGIKGSIGDGALGVALNDAGGPRSAASWSTFDPILAAETVWKGEPRDPRLIDVLSVAQSQFAARVLPATGPDQSSAQQAPSRPRAVDPTDPAGAARLLAGMSPYASVAEAVRSKDKGRVSRHLASVDFNVAEADGLPPSGAGTWSILPAVSPEGSIDSLARLGLLAEWLGAAAFVLRHPDLRLIAQSAERWRRTMAGDWVYETSPVARAPHWRRRPDATIADRIVLLREAADPADSARQQLRLWWGTEARAGDVQAAIERRVPAAVRAGRQAGRDGPSDDAAERAAIALQDRNLPAAFIPAMAVLITRDEEGNRST